MVFPLEDLTQDIKVGTILSQVKDQIQIFQLKVFLLLMLLDFIRGYQKSELILKDFIEVVIVN